MHPVIILFLHQDLSLQLASASSFSRGKVPAAALTQIGHLEEAEPPDLSAEGPMAIPASAQAAAEASAFRWKGLVRGENLINRVTRSSGYL